MLFSYIFINFRYIDYTKFSLILVACVFSLSVITRLFISEFGYTNMNNNWFMLTEVSIYDTKYLSSVFSRCLENGETGG